MNEDNVIEGYISSAEMTPPKKSPKNIIPDAKYYLVRPREGKTVYIMSQKPDYDKEPFYKESEKDLSYLDSYCIGLFTVPSIWEKGGDFLFTLGLIPNPNSIAYIFDKPKENKIDLRDVLSYTDTYKIDDEVANYYKLYDWHIPLLLECDPFKKYIQEHLDGFKVEESEALSTPGPTKESKGTPIILNKRLLI